MATGGYQWFDSLGAGEGGLSQLVGGLGRCALCNGELNGGERALPCYHQFCIKCSPAQGPDCALCAHRAVVTAGHQHVATSSLLSSPQLSDPLSVDTSALIGNLLDSASLEDINSSNHHNATTPHYATSRSSNNLFNLAQRFDLSTSLPLNKAIPFTSGDPRRPYPQCTSCTEGAASSRCEECREYLCAGCVQAHLRVRVTREHHVRPLSYESILPQTNSSGSSSHSPLSPASNGSCQIHQEVVALLCVTCNSAICIRCLSLHKKHTFNHLRQLDSRALTVRLLIEARQYTRGLEETVEAVDRMGERVEARVLSIANEVRAVLHHHISALEERKRDLLQRTDIIRQAKVSTLQSQMEELRQRLSSMRGSLEQVDGLLNGVPVESMWNSQLLDDNTLRKTQELLMHTLQTPRLTLAPYETDELSFVPPNASLLAELRALGAVRTAAYAGHTGIVGESYRRAIRDRVSHFTVQARDHVGDTCSLGGDVITAEVQSPGGANQCPVQVQDRQNGTYLVSYMPKTDGEHRVTIRVRGCAVMSSPLAVRVRQGRDYTQIGARPAFSFGTEGTGDGQLCRPWGICCDREGRIVLADRSNNRVQIFDREGRFISKFGSAGARPGQFDRPAGVCVNSKNEIIIADKDNHRVQVFSNDGSFLFKFGEKGRGIGQFNYPWDVAVNSEDQVAVSDTRNHRVQLFSSTGTFVRKFGFDNSLFYKHFDSPRGLSFLPDGQLLVSDFNNHRLVLLSLQTNDMKFFGREGDWDGAYRRPQGLDVDPEGHVIIADSRNNRLQVLNPELRPLCTFGWDAVERSSIMDRPCDVCSSPDGRIYVVDFGGAYCTSSVVARLLRSQYYLTRNVLQTQLNRPNYLSLN